MNSSMPASMMQAATHVNCHQKPKGISARLFHGFIKKADVIQTPLHDSTSTVTISPDPGSNDEVDMVLGMDFTKNSLRVNESKSSSATKKLKMLGRYFQVIFSSFINLNRRINALCRMTSWNYGNRYRPMNNVWQSNIYSVIVIPDCLNLIPRNHIIWTIFLFTHTFRCFYYCLGRLRYPRK